MRRNRTADRPLIVHGANPVLELLRSSHPVTRVHLGPGPRTRELAVAARERGALGRARLRAAGRAGTEPRPGHGGAQRRRLLARRPSPRGARPPRGPRAAAADRRRPRWGGRGAAPPRPSGLRLPDLDPDGPR